MKSKKKKISPTQLAFWRGYREAIDETSWDCGDCGNRYEATVSSCPNKLTHEANLKTWSSHD